MVWSICFPRLPIRQRGPRRVLKLLGQCSYRKIAFKKGLPLTILISRSHISQVSEIKDSDPMKKIHIGETIMKCKMNWSQIYRLPVLQLSRSYVWFSINQHNAAFKIIIFAKKNGLNLSRFQEIFYNMLNVFYVNISVFMIDLQDKSQASLLKLRTLQPRVQLRKGHCKWNKFVSTFKSVYKKIPKRWYTRPCRTDCMTGTG